MGMMWSGLKALLVSQRFEELDQRPLVRVGQFGAEIMAAILDEVRAFADFPQRRRDFLPHHFLRGGGIKVLQFDFCQRQLDLHAQRPVSLHFQ